MEEATATDIKDAPSKEEVYAKHKIDKKRFYELRAKSKSLEPIVRIGKNAINDNVITNIMQLLRKYRLIKIKVLKNSLDQYSIEQLIESIAKSCDAIVVDKIGLVFTIYKGNSRN
jgi:RNA-binding protein